MTISSADLDKLETNIKGADDWVGGVTTGVAANGRVFDSIAKINAQATSDFDQHLATLGYEPPILFVTDILVDRTTLTVEESGDIFAPLVSEIPFTTTGVFNAAQWYIITDFLPSQATNAGKVLTTDATTASWTANYLAGKTTTASMISASDLPLGSTVKSEGFNTSNDGGGASWVHNGVTGQTVSRTPAQLGDALFNDANGDQWAFLENSTIGSKTIKPEQVGYLLGVVSTANTDAYRAAFNFAIGGGVILLSIGTYKLNEEFLINDRLTHKGVSRQETQIEFSGNPTKTVKTFKVWKTEYDSGNFAVSDDAAIAVGFQVTGAQVHFEDLRITGAFVFDVAVPVVTPIGAYPISTNYSAAILQQVTDMSMTRVIIDGLWNLGGLYIDGSQPTGNTANDRGCYINCKLNGLYGLRIEGAFGQPISGDDFQDLVASDTRGAGGISDLGFYNCQLGGTDILINTDLGNRLVRRSTTDAGGLFIHGQLFANTAKRIQGIRFFNTRLDGVADPFTFKINYANRVSFIETHTDFNTGAFDTDGTTALTSSDFQQRSTDNSQNIRFYGGEKSGEVDNLTYFDTTDTLVYKYGYDEAATGAKDLFAAQKDQGSFVPLFEGSTTPGVQTYSGSTAASFIRTGNLVHVDIRVTLTAFDGATAGNMRITGLPYKAKNNVEVSCSIGIISSITLPTSSTTFGGFINEGDDFIQLVGTGGAFANVVAADMSNTSNITISATYQTDDPTIVT